MRHRCIKRTKPTADFPTYLFPKWRNSVCLGSPFPKNMAASDRARLFLLWLRGNLRIVGEHFISSGRQIVRLPHFRLRTREQRIKNGAFCRGLLPGKFLAVTLSQSQMPVLTLLA